MTVRHKTSKSNAWPAWSGELEDLRRIGRLFESLIEQRRPDLWASHDDQADESPTLKEWRKQRFEEGWRAVAELQDADDQVEGGIEEVLAELDPRSLARLTLRASSDETLVPGDGIAPVLNARSESNPVRLSVNSSDQGWARQALSALSEEIAKGVPKWGRWRSASGRMTLSVVVFLFVNFTGLMLFYSSAQGLVRAAACSAIGIIAGLIVHSTRVINWFLPPLEVTSQAGSTGARRLAGLGALLASVPIGILINLLTN